MKIYYGHSYENCKPMSRKGVRRSAVRGNPSATDIGQMPYWPRGQYQSVRDYFNFVFFEGFGLCSWDCFVSACGPQLAREAQASVTEWIHGFLQPPLNGL